MATRQARPQKSNPRSDATAPTAPNRILHWHGPCGATDMKRGSSLNREHVELSLLVPSTLIPDSSKTKSFTYNSVIAEGLIRKPSSFSTVLSIPSGSLFKSHRGRCSSPLPHTGEKCNSPCSQSPPIQTQDQHFPSQTSPLSTA